MSNICYYLMRVSDSSLKRKTKAIGLSVLVLIVWYDESTPDDALSRVIIGSVSGVACSLILLVIAAILIVHRQVSQHSCFLFSCLHDLFMITSYRVQWSAAVRLLHSCIMQCAVL